MNKNFIVIFVSLMVMVFSGCSNNTPIPNPVKVSTKLSIVKVSRPENIKNNYGEIKSTVIEETKENIKIEKLSFEDELISIQFWKNPDRLNFILKNLSKYTIKIIWDEAAFIDISGQTLRVIKTGTKLSNAWNAPQVPSIVISGGFITDTLVPADRISYVDEYYSTTWKMYLGGYYDFSHLYKNIYYTEAIEREDLRTETENTALKKMQTFFSDGNNEIGIILPIEFEGIKNEYIFKFKVNPYLSKNE